MGREVRRVPSDWEHPKYTKDNAIRESWIGEYKPLYDQDYESAAEEWTVNFNMWQEGKHPSQPCEYCRYYWEYDSPPDEEAYRDRKWTEEDATHFQAYETVSEGTPVTPAFATREALVDYLITYGDFWDQKRGAGGWKREAAERFVDAEFAPSLMVMRSSEGTVIKEPRDGPLD
jgi:hypothetical protein